MKEKWQHRRAGSTASLNPVLLKLLFAVLALGFAGASLFHGLAIVFPGIAEPSPNWRHGLFLLVNALVALGLWKRPRWLIFPFGVLLLQQIYSHGLYALTTWREQGRVDLASAIVLIGVPLVFVMLLKDAKTRE